MKQIVLFLIAVFAVPIQLLAQDEIENHLLNGTTVLYEYKNETMGAVQAEFIDGHFKFKFVKGAYAGIEGSMPYSARLIGDQMYMIGAYEAETNDYVTFVFNFKLNVMYTSAIIEPKTERQMTLFEEGTIINHVLKEH